MRTLLASLVLGLALAFPMPASAQLKLEPCLEDPVQCVDDSAGEVTDSVDEVVETVDEVTDPVDDIVDPDGGGGPAPSDGGNARASEKSSPQGETGRTGGGVPDGSGLAEPISTARPAGVRRVERPSPPVDVVPPPRDPLGSIRQALRGSTESLAFPLTLILVLGAFLLVQGRLDRSDPKLALAPFDPDDDILSF